MVSLLSLYYLSISLLSHHSPISTRKVDDDSQLVGIGRDLSDREKSLLIAACIKVGLLAVFKNHCYIFGEKIFKQVGGGQQV